MDGGRSIGVLLAGGSGSRFAGPGHKLLTEFRGAPLISWGVAAIRAGGLSPWVVTGAIGAEMMELDDDVTVLHNDRWAQGLATSLACALDHARASGLLAITVGPADQPLIPGEAWRRVSAAEPADRLAVATYSGRRANPVRLPSSVWDELPTTGDRGARDLLRNRRGLTIEVACPGNPTDIDTLEDLDRWNS